MAEVTAALNAASQEGSDSGLSAQNKKIIIGVIAGVAGLVVLAALGTLLYRTFGRSPLADDYQETKTDDIHHPMHSSAFDPEGTNSISKSRARVGEISQNF